MVTTLDDIRRCWLPTLGEPFLHYEASLLPPLDRLVGAIRIISLDRHAHGSVRAQGTLALHLSINLLLPRALRLLVAAARPSDGVHRILKGIQVNLLRLSMGQRLLRRCVVPIKAIC